MEKTGSETHLIVATEAASSRMEEPGKEIGRVHVGTSQRGTTGREREQYDTAAPHERGAAYRYSPITTQIQSCLGQNFCLAAAMTQLNQCNLLSGRSEAAMTEYPTSCCEP